MTSGKVINRDQIESQLIKKKIDAIMEVESCLTYEQLKILLEKSRLFQIQVDEELKHNLSINGDFAYFKDGCERNGFRFIDFNQK